MERPTQNAQIGAAVIFQTTRDYSYIFTKETVGSTVLNKGTPPIGTPHIIYRYFSKHLPFRYFRFSYKELFKITQS